MTTDETMKHVRLCLIRYALNPLSPGMAVQYLRGEGFRVERDEVERQLEYLAHEQKGFLELHRDELAPAAKMYRATPKGMDHLAMAGLEA